MTQYRAEQHYGKYMYHQIHQELLLNYKNSYIENKYLTEIVPMESNSTVDFFSAIGALMRYNYSGKGLHFEVGGPHVPRRRSYHEIAENVQTVT